MLQGLNWLAIVVAGVFNWLFGWLWFGPLFGSLFRRIVPGAGTVGGLSLASFIGLGLSLLVATGWRSFSSAPGSPLPLAQF